MGRSTVRSHLASIVVFVANLVTAIAVEGCSMDAPTTNGDVDDKQTRQALIGGAASGDVDNATVLLRVRGGGSCTGVLVAPTLVLTARHCITTGLINSTATQCVLGTDRVASELVTVRVGADPTRLRDYSVKQIVMEYESDNCNVDIAGLVLAEPVDGLAFPPLQLDALPAAGDAVHAIGWGLVSEGVSPSERQRADGSVLGTTGGTYAGTTGEQAVVPDGFIVSNVQSCSGDSGSPLFNGSGALVGIMSSFNYPVAVNFEQLCPPGATRADVPIYRQASLVNRLFQSIGMMPPRAGHPVPADLGGACGESADCNSNFCVGVGLSGMCSKACASQTDCGNTLTCIASGGGASVCLPETTPPPRSDSCTVALPGHDDERSSHVLAAAVALALVARVRRERLGAGRRR